MNGLKMHYLFELFQIKGGDWTVYKVSETGVRLIMTSIKRHDETCAVVVVSAPLFTVLVVCG